MNKAIIVKTCIVRDDDIQYSHFFENKELRKALNKKNSKWYSAKDLVVLWIMNELKKFGIKTTKDEIEYRLLTTVSEDAGKEYKKDLYYLEYYICRVFMKEDVNVYILSDWTIEFASVDEFTLSRALHQINSYITINLNSILAEIYWRKDLQDIWKVQMSNSIDELIILDEIQKAEEKLDVTVSFKNNKELEKITVTRKLTEEERNDIDWAVKKAQFWEISDLKIHRWKVDWKITETKYRKKPK